MGKSRKNLSKHHRIQRCDGGSDVKENIIKLKKSRHQALHTLFGNITLPLEKVKFLLELHKPALAETCYNDIYMIVEFWEKQEIGAYNKSCFKEKNVMLLKN